MAKKIFKPVEIVDLTKQWIALDPPFLEEAAEEETSSFEEQTDKERYEGPTVEELRREAELFQDQWQKKKETLIAEAHQEADLLVERGTDQSKEIVERAENQAQALREMAEKECQQLRSETEKTLGQVEKEAQEKGFSSGSEEGYQAGQAEVKRLVELVGKVLAKTIERRKKILLDTQQQVVDLVLAMAGKVVKVISESQRSVVTNNVIAALKKIRTPTAVEVRANLLDLDLLKAHREDFIRQIETIGNLTFVEDPSIERGGCVVETDFGEIDARISAQLAEVETSVRESISIKSEGHL